MNAALYTVQPITDFTIFTTPAAQRKGVPFKAAWSTTHSELRRELKHLHATDAVLELAVKPHHVRLDGQLRSDVPNNLPHPGVRLSFQTRDHGSLSYTCDTYSARYYGQLADWQANLRAIVLTLEALRAVDRYGATKGEQYAGFKAIGPGSGATALGGMTRDQAYDTLYQAAGIGPDDDDDTGDERTLYRRARARAHPDRNDGDRSLWDQVETAALVLGLDR